MIVQFGNLYYFIYIAIFLLLVVLVGLLLKNKKKNTQYKILLIIAFANFVLHFLKLLIPKYFNDLPISIRKITFENICAVSTLIFPFIMLSKNKYLKDYMVYLGMLSGLVAIIYPTEAFNKNIFDVDLIRFYICHSGLFVVAFYTAIFKIHELNIRRIIFVPLTFIIILCVILVNEIILMEAGFVDMRGNDFLNYNYRNSNFIFGPTSSLKEISDMFLDWMVPRPFKTVLVGEYAGTLKYIPIVWLIVPCFIYLPILSLIIYFIMRKVSKKAASD